MKKLIAIVVAVTLVAVGSGVALGQDDESFLYCTDTPQYPQVKVAQVPIPWQFWAIETDPDTGVTTVIDRIRISPTWLNPPGDQPPGEGAVFIRRWFAVVPGAGNFIPLEELVWGSGPGPPSMAAFVWELVDDPDPILVEPGFDYDLPIPVTENDGAVLVAYEVTTEAAEPEGHFINEAILESSSPQAIVQVLVNFDIHNGTGRNDITNFELDFLGLEFGYLDVVDALGFVAATGIPPVPIEPVPWGANADNPLVVRPIEVTLPDGTEVTGTEVKWVQPDRPLANCEWLHVGLVFNYPTIGDGVIVNPGATVQGYWTIQPRPRRTPGYWKNHPEAWPVETITIGVETYSRDEAIDEMKTPGKGDKSYTMFRALVAAKLNVLIGNDPCIQGTIDAADAWMEPYELGGGAGGVRGKDSAWRAGEPLYEDLDLYNNGGFCP